MCYNTMHKNGYWTIKPWHSIKPSVEVCARAQISIGSSKTAFHRGFHVIIVMVSCTKNVKTHHSAVKI